MTWKPNPFNPNSLDRSVAPWVPPPLQSGHYYHTLVSTLRFWGSTSVSPLTWRLLCFLFLTPWLLFAPVKAAALLCPRMLGFSAEQKAAWNLMKVKAPDLPAEHSLRCGVRRLSLPYVTLSAIYSLSGNFTGKALLEMFILGFHNLFLILI